jgi:hypothetical protein
MDTLLLTVTGISLVVAAASSTIAWRLLRAERARTAARVAALAAAAGIDRATTASEATPESEVADGLQEFLPAHAGAATVATDSAAASASGMVVDAGAIFMRPAVDSGSSGRQRGLMAAAAAFALVVIGGGAVLFVSGRTPGATVAAPRPPLELVALSHQRTDGVLAVSGLVRNPASGRPVDRVEAEVRVFDSAGLMTVSRTAVIDLTRLAPGQESPFVVALGEAATAARYRVSFKAEGTMLPHVDRRTNLPAAVTADAR